MKKYLIFFSLYLALQPLKGQAPQPKELFYFVEVKNYFDGEDKPYVEIILNIDGNTLNPFLNEKMKWKSEVAVALQVTKVEGDPNLADYLSKFILESPDLADTTAASLTFSLLEIRRAQLEPGNYKLTGFLVDRGDSAHKEYRFQRDLIIEPASISSVSISSIEFINSFKPAAESSRIAKHGYEIIPMVTNSTFVDSDSLRLYAEVYNADKFLSGFYFASVYISRVNSTSPVEGYKRTLKVPAQGLDAIKSGFDISKLPSEAYYLNIDIYNKENNVVASAAEKFFVSNSSVENVSSPASGADWQAFNLTEEQLTYYIPTLSYISTETEKQFGKAVITFDEKKNYFYNFWVKRKENPADHPVRAWKQYEAMVLYSNQHFKAVHKEGWRTDRGRVMLMYGPPNDVEQHLNENDRYPSEYWRYNRIKAQSNVFFVFYDPDGITGDFPLLHSDKIGESPNPRWKLDLVRRNVNDANLDHDNIDGPSTVPFRDR